MVHQVTENAPEYFIKTRDANKVYEARLDEHFSELYRVVRVSSKLQAFGIDRKWYDLDTRARYLTEYKTDHGLARYGNVFVETVSVDVAGKDGWGITSIAGILVCYSPEWGKAYMASMPSIKAHIPAWLARYGEKPCRDNPGYTSWGIPVPLAEFRSRARLCEHDEVEIPF